MTFLEYCEQNWSRKPYPIIDHALRINRRPDGTFEFYIHPSKADGITSDFIVDNSSVRERQEINGVLE